MSKLKNCVEGIIITALGGFFLYLAFSVRNNPIPYGSGWINVVAQAKFLPVIMACFVTLLGIVMIILGLMGKLPSAKFDKGEPLRLFIVVVLVAAYLLGINYFGFQWPTIAFSIVSAVFFNWKKRPWWQMLIIAAVYIVVGLWGLPKLIGLRLV